LIPHESDVAVTPWRVAKVIWRRKLVCLAVALIVIAGGCGWLLTRPKEYQSTASVALLPDSTNTSILPNYPNLIASLIPTYVQLVSSPVMVNQVAATLPFTISAAQLGSELHAESLSSAAIVNIVATDRDPVHAQQIAARATAVFLVELHGNGVVVAHLYGRPTVPSTPASPKVKLTLAVIVALAILLGVGAGLVWDRLFGGEASPDDLTAKVRPPVLGVIPVPAERPHMNSILGSRDATAQRDRWRLLQTNFMYATTGQQVRSVTVTSLGPGEGKTSVAVILAASLAELGLSVILVDAALRTPALHEVFELDNDRGLTSTVLDEVPPESLLRPIPAMAGLQVVTAGPRMSSPRDEALCLQQLPRLRSLADLVVVNGPALAGDDDALLTAGVTDGAILVARLRPWQADAGLAMLENSRVRVIGTVLTDITPAKPGAKPETDSAPSAAYREPGPPAGVLPPRA
jgi:polysaccharide biosynthesis transport protein